MARIIPGNPALAGRSWEAFPVTSSASRILLSSAQLGHGSIGKHGKVERGLLL